MHLKWQITIALFCVIALLITFQNCAQSTLGTASNESSEVYVDPRFKNLPFPYSITANHLAYMSCGDGKNFTFKIGAYSDSDATYPFSNADDSLSSGGLSLTSSFLESFEAALPSTITETEKTNKLREALMTISVARNIQPFLSVRSPIKNGDIAKPDAILSYEKGGSKISYYFPLGILSNTEFASLMSKNSTQHLNYFPSASEDNRSLEAELVFKYSQDEDGFISDVNNNGGGLLLGFTKRSATELDTNNIEVSRSDAESYSKAYGQYLKLNFTSQPAHKLHSKTLSLPQRLLDSVTEENLENTSDSSASTANWSCSSFMIVKSGDRESKTYKNKKNKDGEDCSVFSGKNKKSTHTNCKPSKICPYETYEDLTNGNDSAKNLALLYALRRFLPVEDWDININDKCIVPKTTNVACYSSGTGSGTAGAIAYDQVFFPSHNANALDNVTGVEWCGGDYRPCAHYFSICLRKGS